ncbi:MAG: spore cortex-lytic enzyme [Clostridia bacterium]|nr:spore cortex-lytic enzyme [Clostridia bacterium]MBR3593476.1 spore cortex-lytic enzyme [Clostridia bacterium]
MKKTIKILCLTLIYIICIAPSVFSLSKIGSRGDEVLKIQQKLNALGYGIISEDGIFGTETQKALMRFQSDYGLTVDGIAGEWTLRSLGIKENNNAHYSSADYELLARIISAEARGEPYSGQVAVGAVILNRIAHPSFPETISGVIYQPGAFSCLYDGQFYEPIASSAYSAARDALNGVDPSGGAIYYYNPRTATNKWIRSRPVITTIGRHVFCE